MTENKKLHIREHVILNLIWSRWPLVNTKIVRASIINPSCIIPVLISIFMQDLVWFCVLFLFGRLKSGQHQHSGVKQSIETFKKSLLRNDLVHLGACLSANLYAVLKLLGVRFPVETTFSYMHNLSRSDFKKWLPEILKLRKYYCLMKWLFHRQLLAWVFDRLHHCFH